MYSEAVGDATPAGGGKSTSKRGKYAAMGFAVLAALLLLLALLTKDGKPEEAGCKVKTVVLEDGSLPEACVEADFVECADFCEEVECYCDGLFFTNYSGPWKGDNTNSGRGLAAGEETDLEKAFEVDDSETFEVDDGDQAYNPAHWREVSFPDKMKPTYARGRAMTCKKNQWETLCESEGRFFYRVKGKWDDTMEELDVSVETDEAERTPEGPQVPGRLLQSVDSYVDYEVKNKQRDGGIREEWDWLAHDEVFDVNPYSEYFNINGCDWDETPRYVSGSPGDDVTQLQYYLKEDDVCKLRIKGGLDSGYDHMINDVGFKNLRYLKQRFEVRYNRNSGGVDTLKDGATCDGAIGGGGTLMGTGGSIATACDSSYWKDGCTALGDRIVCSSEIKARKWYRLRLSATRGLHLL